MTRKNLLLIPLSGALFILLSAVAAFACTTFAGQFKVTGDQGGTVTGTGVPGGNLMTSILTGSTSASDGTDGTIAVETAAVGTPVEGETSLPDGYYSINVWDGNAYSNQSTISGQPPFLTIMQDCMNSPTGSTETLGHVRVDSNGIIDEKDGTAVTNGQATFDNLNVSATTDTSIVGPLGGGEAAVCISGTNSNSTSNDGGSVGNQVPIAFV